MMGNCREQFFFILSCKNIRLFIFGPYHLLICMLSALGFILVSALTTVALGLTQYTQVFSTSTNPYSTTYTPVYSLGNMTLNYTIEIVFSSQSFQAHADSLVPSGLSTLVVEDNVTGAALTSCSTMAVSEVFQYSRKCTIPANSTYRIRFTQANRPSNTAGTATPITIQHFHLLVTYYNATGDLSPGNTNIQTRLKVTEVFRDRVTKLLYLGTNDGHSFTMYPVDSLSVGTGNPDTPVSTQTLRLFKVNAIRSTGNIYSAQSNTDMLTDSSKTTWSYSSLSRSLSYRVNEGKLEQGYYILVASYDTADVSFIRITYQSDQYLCPYDLYYPDYNGNFQPCRQKVAADISNQCIVYDFILGVCTACMYGFSLVQGSCHASTSCPSYYYFHFGSCLAVSPSCGNYDIYTGTCLSCRDYTYELVNQTCKARVVTCTDRQYVYNYTCLDVDISCNTYDNLTGLCTSCYLGYALGNGRCAKQTVTCQGLAYPDQNNLCQPYPAECLIFNPAERKCSTCHPGYSNDQGTCQRINCPSRMYPSPFGWGSECLAVSPLCLTYDPMNGDCLSCIPGYTIMTGQCKQVVSFLSGCQQRQQMGFGPCVGNELNCEIFNGASLNCVICKKGYNLDYRGICTADEVCRENEWNNHGICLQMPANCKDVDYKGRCIDCQTTYRLVKGYCQERTECSPGQYLTQDHQCADVGDNCLFANPSTGQCITCSAGYSMSAGFCCPEGQIYTGSFCSTVAPSELLSLSLTSQTCILFHPQLGTCLQCRPGFQVDPSTRTTCMAV